MTTLTDVAKEANVSKMTVSRVINHPEQVTPELRDGRKGDEIIELSS